MSKNPPFYLHYIILAVFCQALAFFTLLGPNANAFSSALEIDCPSEINPGETAVCTISIASDVEINRLTGNFSAENLEVSDFTPTSPWTSSNTDTILDISSTTESNSQSKVGTFKITPKTADSTGSILIDNLVFEYTERYSFSVSSPFIKIKINPAPKPPTCADDEELINGTCMKKCLEGEERIDDVCVATVVECADDQELVDGVCVKKCLEGEERIDGVCVTTIVECADDEELIDGVCVKKIIECARDEELVDGVCVKKCANDEKRNTAGVCVKITTAPTCKANETLIDGKCSPKNDTSLPIIIIIVASSVALAGIVALIIIIKKRKKESEESPTGSYLSFTHGGNTPPEDASSEQPSQTPPTYDNSSYLTQPTSPTADQRQPSSTPQPPAAEPTKPVALSKPTTPNIFES